MTPNAATARMNWIMRIPSIGKDPGCMSSVVFKLLRAIFKPQETFRRYELGRYRCSLVGIVMVQDRALRVGSMPWLYSPREQPKAKQLVPGSGVGSRISRPTIDEAERRHSVVPSFGAFSSISVV